MITARRETGIQKDQKVSLVIECDTAEELDAVIQSIKREQPNSGVFLLLQQAVKEATE